MGYRLKRSEGSEEAIKRILKEQIKKALDEMESRSGGVDNAVHQVRKRCKKIRGALRLVRPEIGDAYSRENSRYRDAARMLSAFRDANTMIETVDKLIKHYGENIDTDSLLNLRQILQERHSEYLYSEQGSREIFEEFIEQMREGKKALKSLSCNHKQFRALEKGFGLTYKRGRKAIKKAYKKDDSEHFHEWRKRVKYHGYHVRILEKMWKKMLHSHRKELEKLADILGDEHDLSVLHETILKDSSFSELESKDTILGLISLHQKELRDKAYKLGAKIYTEKPKQLKKRFKSYWKIWKK